MTKILFVIPSFTIGGTVISLQSLLFQIKESYDISIYSRSSLGGKKSLFRDYRVLKENIWLSTTVRSRGLMTYLLSAVLQATIKLLKKLKIDLTPYCVRRGCKKIKSYQYDLVVSYQESLASFVGYFPGKKACWIHSDIRRLDYGDSFASFDHIICVSEFAKQCFLSKYPLLTDRTKVIYNRIDDKYIMSKANQGDVLDVLFDCSKFTIVSVGRLDNVKQFDKIPAIAKRLKSEIGSTFKWYIIGYSRQFLTNRERLQTEINQNDLSAEVILLKEKNNVYPYIAKSDVLVITSKSETFSLVAFEARVLGTPIIINDIPIAQEILTDDSGIISDLDNMHEAILRIYKEPFRVKSYISPSLSALSNFDTILE